MPYDLVVEDPAKFFFITNRTIGSRLWFVNNRRLENRICAYLAKYAAQYGVVVAAFVIMGNHYHLVAYFPLANRSAFLRDFDAMVARLVRTHVKEFDVGPLWARRPKCHKLPNAEDVENWFFYTALNPVSSGLADRISNYPGYNSFSDAILGRKLRFKIFKKKEYNDRRRFNPSIRRQDFIETVELSFARLPGYENLSAEEYRRTMLAKLENRRCKLIETLLKSGKQYPAPEKLRRIRAGSLPHATKTSTRNSHRPIVLTLCSETRAICLSIYFATVAAYKKASERFRKGDRLAVFPPGTHLPTSPPIWAT